MGQVDKPQLPLVTAAVTSFNAEDTIERALRGVMRQDWPNLEIVVTDDGSSDGSREVIRRVAAEDERIKLHCHEVNRGFPSALNTIFANARGEFVCIFDDDDEPVVDRIRAQWERISEYEREHGVDLVFCYADRKVIWPSGEVSLRKAIGRVAPEPSGDAVADYLLSRIRRPGFFWGSLGCCTLMARKTTFEAAGLFDPEFRRVQDREIAVRLARMGGHCIAVPRPLITQYITPTADKAGTIRLEAVLNVLQKHRDYLVARRRYHFSRAAAHLQFFNRRTAGRWKRMYYFALACAMRPRFVLERAALKRSDADA